MEKAKAILRKRREAKGHLETLFMASDNVFIFHYSCESLCPPECEKISASPRITSIAIRNLKTGRSKSFSFFSVIERLHPGEAEIESRYDEIEKALLDDFYDFVNQHHRCKWLFWAMRNATYGFDAIERRYRILGGVPVLIPDNELFDLKQLFFDMYSDAAMPHGDRGRLNTLIKLNKITDIDMLHGSEEPIAFEEKNFRKIELSVLRKVDCLAALADRAEGGKLKTKPVIWESGVVYNFYMFCEWVKENPVVIFIITGFTLVASVIGLICDLAK